MTEKEHFFWNKLLELAKEELTQATFDYYVLDTKLIKVQNNVATILLEEVKKLFWEKNMQSFILMAGFEAYNSEIKVEYVFDEALINEANSTVANNDFGNKKEQQTPALPTLDSDLNSKYTFDNFIQGDENRWSVAASLAVADSPGATYNLVSGKLTCSMPLETRSYMIILKHALNTLLQRILLMNLLYISV